MRRSLPWLVVALVVAACAVMYFEISGTEKRRGAGGGGDPESAGVSVPCSGDTLTASIGTETLGGIFSPIFLAGSTLPLSRTEVYSTSHDNQPAVDFHVLQGFRPLARHNRSLARIQVAGIPPAPRGVPQIKVTFSIDRQGVLRVEGEEPSTGTAQQVLVESASELTAAQVEELKQEAERFAQADAKEVLLVESRNQAELMIYVARHHVLARKPPLAEADHAVLSDRIARLEGARKGGDTDAITKGMDALQRELERVVKKKYVRERGVFSE